MHTENNDITLQIIHAKSALSKDEKIHLLLEKVAEKRTVFRCNLQSFLERANKMEKGEDILFCEGDFYLTPIIETYEMELRFLLSEAQNSFSDGLCESLVMPSAARVNYLRTLAQMIDIKLLKRDAAKVIFYMPMPPRKIENQYRSTPSGKPFRASSKVWFAEDIITVLEHEKLFEEIFSRPEWKEKTITVFYIYGIDDKEILDTDNHEIKQIIDAIATQIPSGDTGVSTDIFQKTRQVSFAKKGCYIILKPGLESDAKTEEIYNILLQNPEGTGTANNAK